MRKEKILKLMVVLTIGIVLVAMTSNVFAADSNSTVDFFEDTTNQLNTNTNTNTSTNTNTNTNTNINTATNTNNVNTTTTDATANTNTNAVANTSNYNTSLPKAGLKENTMMGVAMTVLAVVAVFAYKKINQYKNI